MKVPKDELTALLALSQIKQIGASRAKLLYETVGSAQEIFRKSTELNDIIPGVSQIIKDALDNSGCFFAAEKELEFIKAKKITCLTPEEPDYPERLRPCSDAPLVLYYRGNANLNASKVVSIVGTRRATDYGRRLTGTFIQELKELFPNVLIISGLAYGIDGEAHKCALKYGYDTVGVLAHGLDTIYPAAHRNLAATMTERGGVITEFMSGTIPFAQNFVSRNRIITSLSDATIVVESRAKGGSLISAEMADGYNRDCFTFPGLVWDPSHEGCHELIMSHKATMICSARDFAEQMNWRVGKTRKRDVQKELFEEYDQEQKEVLELLLSSPEGIQINTLVVKANKEYNRLISVLTELELAGAVTLCAGGIYKCL